MDNDYKICNVERQANDKDSVLNFYRNLIELRKKYAALIYGDISIVNKKVHNLFSYYRIGQHETLYIECNLGRKEMKRKASKHRGKLLLSNYREVGVSVMKPYEANVWLTDS